MCRHSGSRPRERAPGALFLPALPLGQTRRSRRGKGVAGLRNVYRHSRPAFLLVAQPCRFSPQSRTAEEGRRHPWLTFRCRCRNKFEVRHRPSGLIWSRFASRLSTSRSSGEITPSASIALSSSFRTCRCLPSSSLNAEERIAAGMAKSMRAGSRSRESRFTVNSTGYRLAATRSVRSGACSAPNTPRRG